MALPVARIQSCKQTRASSVVAVIRLRKSDRTLFPVLKADSDATAEAGAAKISAAMRLSVGYSPEFVCHHARILNWSLQRMGTFDKYESSSVESKFVDRAVRVTCWSQSAIGSSPLIAMSSSPPCDMGSEPLSFNWRYSLNNPWNTFFILEIIVAASFPNSRPNQNSIYFNLNCGSKITWIQRLNHVIFQYLLNFLFIYLTVVPISESSS